MRSDDLTRLTLGAVAAQRGRSVLTALGIAIGIAAVVLLTAIGEGVQRFVLAEFTQFGTHLIAINPGKTETFGTPVGAFGSTRPLTLEDAGALRRIPSVEAVVPFVGGNAVVEGAGRQRRTNVYGVGHQLPEVWRFPVAAGRFLPDDPPWAARAFAVLGSKLKRELFGDRNPLGQRIRIGGDRYRVVGTMEAKGQLLGFDMDDTVYVPAGRALGMFDREGLMEVDLLFRADAVSESVAEAVRRVLTARHGREDYTLITQEQMLEVLNSVLEVLTFAVAALGGISLVVGGVGILTIMTIAVRERTPEVGLLRALGARRRQVLALFLGEATLLAALGGAAGLLLGAGLAWALAGAFPALPVHVSWFYIALAELLAVVIGIVAGVLPARHAAHMDPVDALRAE